MPAIALLTTILSLIPTAVSAGKSVADLVELGLKIGKSDADPTDEDWAKLHEIEATLAAKIDEAAAANG